MTQQIKLKAKLKAYSKAPFYLDYVRSVNVVNGVEETLEPNTVYGLKNGQWYKLFLGDVEEVNNRLSSLELVTKNISEDILPTTQRDSALAVQYVKNIKIEEDLDENSIIFTDQYGTPHRIRLQVQVDNKSIQYNNYNQLELVNKIDNTTIQEDSAGNMVVNSIHAMQLIDGQLQDVYITGDEILSTINALKNNNFILQDNLYTGDQKAINTIDEDTVEYLYKLIKEHDAQISICIPKAVYSCDFKIKQPKEKITNPTSKEMIRKILVSEENAGAFWNKLYRKDIFKTIRFEDRIINDVVVMYKIYLEAEKIVQSNQIKYYYYQHL